MKFKLKVIFVFTCFIVTAFSQTALPDSLLRDEPIKNASKAIYLSLAMPGAGQYYNESYIKSAIYFSSFAIFTYQAFHYDDLHDKIKHYAQSSTPINEIESDYLIQENGVWIKNISHIANRRSDSIRKRNRAIWRGLGVYLLNVLDAYAGAYLFRFDDLMGDKKTNLKIENTSVDQIQLKFSYNF